MFAGSCSYSLPLEIRRKKGRKEQKRKKRKYLSIYFLVYIQKKKKKNKAKRKSKKINIVSTPNFRDYSTGEREREITAIFFSLPFSFFFSFLMDMNHDMNISMMTMRMTGQWSSVDDFKSINSSIYYCPSNCRGHYVSHLCCTWLKTF